MKDRNNGFSTAGWGIVTSLQALGHEVPYQDANAPVQLNFCHPNLAEWGNNYNISYVPWESTALPADWLEPLREADEIWTPSEFVKGVIESYGLEVARVYPHGVEPIWTRRPRRRGKVLRFLHVGEPAPRKGGQMALDAFREVFGDRTDVHLTIKAYNRNMAWAKDFGNGRMNPQDVYNNVTVNRRPLEVEQLVNLFHEHDVLVYPSWGEGFGLIPLQAMATGMPTICTKAWAPYWPYLHDDLSLKSKLVPSPWSSNLHPGSVFKPDYDDLVEIYRLVDDYFDHYAFTAFGNARHVHQEYDWNRVTAEAFENIVKRFS